MLPLDNSLNFRRCLDRTRRQLRFRNTAAASFWWSSGGSNPTSLLPRCTLFLSLRASRFPAVFHHQNSSIGVHSSLSITSSNKHVLPFSVVLLDFTMLHPLVPFAKIRHLSSNGFIILLSSTCHIIMRLFLFSFETTTFLFIVGPCVHLLNLPVEYE